MSQGRTGRRMFLKGAASGILSSAGVLPMLQRTAFALDSSDSRVLHEVASPGIDVNAKPKYSIKFAVIGMSHYHIYDIVETIVHSGGVLTAAYAAEPENGTAFAKRFPQARLVRSEDEILNDPSIQLVLSAAVPDQRALLGIRVMKHGKDFLSDKPGITSLEQLADVRKVQAETRRIFGIMYSGRLEVPAAVRAGELIHAGAIGQVVQTLNIAPHQINQAGGSPRPSWFWDAARYGGIITDIGSHQADQFLYYTGSTEAEVVASQVGNINHKDRPKFQDFGDAMLRGDRGVGYMRMDWFTPDGLGTWGDDRIFILGTEGYIELRPYVDLAGRKGNNHLFIVEHKQTRYIDCSNVALPFGLQFVSDVVNRTQTGQNQKQCLLAAELVLKAQRNAQMLKLAT